MKAHLAHKAEHGIDLESGAMVAVTLQGADAGDTTSLVETAIAAAEQVEAAHAASATPAALTELIADKGYHSNQTMVDLHAVGVRPYIAEPDRGRRHWTNAPEAQRAVYGNRRRVRGARGKRLMRRRGEYVERSFAHVYDTGGMRRTHLRGHPNILKRLLIHASGFNLGILMRQVFGRGTPRGLQGDPLDARSFEIALAMLTESLWAATSAFLTRARLRPPVLRGHSEWAIA
jgi:transposase